jgi:hypothetical protein
MAVIVLVHGIAQELRKPGELEAEWLHPLEKGVRDAGFPAIADRLRRDQNGRIGIDTRMAFYGDLFLRSGQQGLDPGSAAETALAKQLAEAWLEHAAQLASDPKEKLIAARELNALRDNVGVPQGKVARLAIKSLAKLRWFAPFGMAFAEAFVDRSLGQVTRYLTDESIRTAAQDRVKSLIGPETKVVIGHSLGSVVAYEAIQQLQQPVPLFLTIGSPLGLDTIIYPRLRPQPPNFPAQVKKWVNVSDTDDFIAAEPSLTNLFKEKMPGDAVFEGDYRVKNGAQPHRADSYLAHIESCRPIGSVLSATS